MVSMARLVPNQNILTRGCYFKGSIYSLAPNSNLKFICIIGFVKLVHNVQEKKLCTNFNDNAFIEIPISRMGILVLITMTILETFRIIVCHKYVTRI